MTAGAGFAAQRDDASAAWFGGLAEGRLLIRQCASCGHFGRPEIAACPACHSADLAWAASAGTGTVVAVIVDHGGDEQAPLGLVELDEGPWLLVRFTGASPAQAGARVRLAVHTAEGSEPIPVFTTSPDYPAPPASS